MEKWSTQLGRKMLQRWSLHLLPWGEGRGGVTQWEAGHCTNGAGRGLTLGSESCSGEEAPSSQGFIWVCLVFLSPPLLTWDGIKQKLIKKTINTSDYLKIGNFRKKDQTQIRDLFKKERKKRHLQWRGHTSKKQKANKQTNLKIWNSCKLKRDD